MSQVTRLSNLIGIIFFALLVSAGSLSAQPVLTVDDCAKCHSQQPQEVAEAGAAHGEAINCQDCHTGHRPSSASNIPQCSDCHAGSVHYELQNCLRCHNPHQPLKVVLTGELKAECLTCHSAQNDQMTANPSAHASFSCNFCHADTHGMIPECLQCHEPHSEQMTQNDCATCHDVHQPLVLKYPDSTPNLLCAVCHETPVEQLAATTTMHHDVSCVTCHANQHKTIPMCTDCHDLPHAAGIHKKFPTCGTCHNTAHDLNHFTAEAGK